MAKSRRRVTQAEVDRWRRLQAEGKNALTIATLDGRSHNTVGDYLSGLRVVGEQKKPGPPPEVGPAPVCVECAAWAAAFKEGRVPKLRRCPRHGGDGG